MDFDYTTETITPDNSGTLTIDGHMDVLGHMSPSVATIAASTTFIDPPAITSTVTILTATSSGRRVILPLGPNVTSGTQITLVNTSVYAINVFPPVGGTINNWAVDVPFVLPAGDGVTLSTLTYPATTWYSNTPSLVAGSNISLTHELGKITIAGSAGGGGMSFTTIKTAQYTAAVNEIVRVNSSATGFTITLPATPADGYKVGIFDVVNACDVHPVLVAPNGVTVEGDATALSIDVKGAYVELVYDASTSNWKIADTYSNTYNVQQEMFSPFLLMGA